MHRVLLAALLLLASPGPLLADDCAERVERLLIDSIDSKPARGHIVSEIKGQPATENDFITVSWDHYLYKPTKPANGAWLLTHDGTTYQSADGGETWTKAYSFDKDQTRAANVATVTQQAGTIRNAVCGTEDLDGVPHQTLEADMTNPGPPRFEIHSKYWVAPETGFVARATTRVTSDSFESFTTQTWEPAEGLTLPTPSKS